MRYIYFLLTVTIFIFPVFLVEAKNKPCLLNYASPGQEEILGKSLLKYGAESFAEIRACNNFAYALIATTGENGESAIRGGIYNFKTQKSYRERRPHTFTYPLCDIQNTTHGYRLDYLCSNANLSLQPISKSPAVEYSFIGIERRTYFRKCTIFHATANSASIPKTTCGRWKSI